MMFLPKITIIVVIWQFFLPLLALCYSTMENGEPSTYLSTYLFISVWTYELLVYLKGLMHFWSFAGGSVVKNLSSSVGDMGSIPGSGRSPGEGNGNPLQYSCLENPMDGGALWATVHGVAKSQTQLSNFTFTLPRGKRADVWWELAMRWARILDTWQASHLLCSSQHMCEADYTTTT